MVGVDLTPKVDLFNKVEGRGLYSSKPKTMKFYLEVGSQDNLLACDSDFLSVCCDLH